MFYTVVCSELECLWLWNQVCVCMCAQLSQDLSLLPLTSTACRIPPRPK